MIKVGGLCEISGSTIDYMSFISILNFTRGPKTESPKGANIDEEDSVSFISTQAVVIINGRKYSGLQTRGRTRFFANGMVGLIVCREGDWTKMLIEDNLYKVPTDKLKEISI